MRAASRGAVGALAMTMLPVVKLCTNVLPGGLRDRVRSNITELVGPHRRLDFFGLQVVLAMLDAHTAVFPSVGARECRATPAAARSAARIFVLLSSRAPPCGTHMQSACRKAAYDAHPRRVRRPCEDQAASASIGRKARTLLFVAVPLLVHDRQGRACPIQRYWSAARHEHTELESSR